MSEVDVKNIEIISDLVEKHFCLAPSSLVEFKKRIREPSIDGEYLKRFKLGDDYRFRMPIPRSFASTVDAGWSIFTRHFRTFVEYFGMTYDNFVDNKVIINKNSVKLRKAIISFYSDFRDVPADKLTFVSAGIIDFCMNHIPFGTAEKKHLIQNKVLHNNVIEYLEKTIDDILMDISKKCLPKSDIELVFSFNFADWFLCSTAESWKSCLNLESEFHASYWTGLPGLAGDMNRCMIYMTDNSKKEYLGIVVDKVIARSWALMSKEDIPYIIKPYPLADIFNAELISSVTGSKFCDMSSSRANSFASKHKIDLLRFDTERKPSVYIFQDFTRFDEYSRIVRNSENGFWCFYDDKLSVGEPVVNYSGGFRRLISKKEKIDKYFIVMKTCSCCGRNGYDIPTIPTGEGDAVVCKRCIDNEYFKCHSCDIFHKKEKSITVNAGRKILFCKPCFEFRKNDYIKCDHCREYFAKSIVNKIHLSPFRVVGVCPSCFQENQEELYSEFIKCNSSGCKKYHRKEELISVSHKEEKLLCEKCIKVANDRKQYELSFDEDDRAGNLYIRAMKAPGENYIPIPNPFEAGIVADPNLIDGVRFEYNPYQQPYGAVPDPFIAVPAPVMMRAMGVVEDDGHDDEENHDDEEDHYYDEDGDAIDEEADE